MCDNDRICVYLNHDPYTSLGSCSTQFYQQYLRWVLDRGGIQKKDSLKTNWYYIRMPHRDRCGQDMDKAIGNNISMVYSPSYLIPIPIMLTKCVSILVPY